MNRTVKTSFPRTLVVLVWGLAKHSETGEVIAVYSRNLPNQSAGQSAIRLVRGTEGQP